MDLFSVSCLILVDDVASLVLIAGVNEMNLNLFRILSNEVIVIGFGAVRHFGIGTDLSNLREKKINVGHATCTDRLECFECVSQDTLSSRH